MLTAERKLGFLLVESGKQIKQEVRRDKGQTCTVLDIILEQVRFSHKPLAPP